MPRPLALITLLLAFAAPAAAQTHGGTEAGGAVAPTGGHVATVTDGRITVSAKSDAVLGRTVRFRGHVPTSDAGRTITIERFDEKAESRREDVPVARPAQSGTELVSTVVQAAGELASIGVTIGGQILKRAAQKLPRP